MPMKSAALPASPARGEVLQAQAGLADADLALGSANAHVAADARPRARLHWRFAGRRADGALKVASGDMSGEWTS
jgi:hypothetical protein